MKNATMLYKCPGEHRTDGYTYDYTIVDADEIEAAEAEGWHLTLPGADALAKEAAAEKLAANEAEQARVAAELAKAEEAEAKKAAKHSKAG